MKVRICEGHVPLQQSGHHVLRDGLLVAEAIATFSQPNTLLQESVRAFYRGWYNELITVVPRIENGYVYPMEGPGLGVELQPAVFKRQDLTIRRTPGHGNP